MPLQEPQPHLDLDETPLAGPLQMKKPDAVVIVHMKDNLKAWTCSFQVLNGPGAGLRAILYQGKRGYRGNTSRAVACGMWRTASSTAYRRFCSAVE